MRATRSPQSIPKLTPEQRRHMALMTVGPAAGRAFVQWEEAGNQGFAKREKPMNLLYIGTDTWRADHLGCYGNSHVRTPNMDQLASEGVLCTNAYADDLPTIPCRRVIYTGKSIIPLWDFGNWRPLFEDDITFAEMAALQGYNTGLIADCYHFFKAGMNLHQGYMAWDWVRGQEFDPWQPGSVDPIDTRDYVPENLWIEGQNPALTQYLRNTQDMRSEDDYFCARTCRKAMQWLERRDPELPFVLWLELFDPHEPWDAPRRFQEMYVDPKRVEKLLFSYGANISKLTGDDIEVLRGMYAAEVSFTDMWLGRLLRRVEELGLQDDTLIVFSSDHGTHIGEEGCVHKTAQLLDSRVAQVPLIIRHPDTDTYAGKRVDGLVSVMDYAPTLLDLLGLDSFTEMDGTSFWPMVDGKADAIHDEVITGFGLFASVRTADWHYFENVLNIGTPRSPNAKKHALVNLPHAHDPGKGPCLYDLKSDPGETANVVDAHPDVVKDLRARLAKRFDLEPK